MYILDEHGGSHKLQPSIDSIIAFTNICLSDAYSPNAERVCGTLELIVKIYASFKDKAKSYNLGYIKQIIGFLSNYNSDDKYNTVLSEANNYIFGNS